MNSTHPMSYINYNAVKILIGRNKLEKEFTRGMGKNKIQKTIQPWCDKICVNLCF